MSLSSVFLIAAVSVLVTFVATSQSPDSSEPIDYPSECRWSIWVSPELCLDRLKERYGKLTWELTEGLMYSGNIYIDESIKQMHKHDDGSVTRQMNQILGRLPATENFLSAVFHHLVHTNKAFAELYTKLAPIIYVKTMERTKVASDVADGYKRCERFNSLEECEVFTNFNK